MTIEMTIAREGEGVGVDGLRFAADPAQRREGDRRGEHEQETGLEKRHHRLDLGVAEMVVFVGRLVRFAHGVIGQAAGGDVEAVVRRLGEQRERAGHQPRRRISPASSATLAATEASAVRRFRRASGGNLASGGHGGGVWFPSRAGSARAAL